jgi:CarD family transcriptional regulator
MQFHIGENVVYPPYGIAVIANITERCFGSVPELCYHLRLSSKNITAIVPAHSAREVGLRKLVKQADTRRVLSFLANGKFPTCSDWKIRARDNAIRLQSGDLLQAAEVYKSLTQISDQKPLTTVERTMLHAARQLVAAEISLANHVTEADAVASIEKAVGRALRRYSSISRRKPALKYSTAHA